MSNRTANLTPAETAVADAKAALEDALRRRTNGITRAKRQLREAEAALAAAGPGHYPADR